MKSSGLVEAVSRKGSSCSKWDGMQSLFGTNDILPMWVADSDLSAPREVTDALLKRAAHPCYGYHFAPETYWKAVADWFLARQGLHLELEWLRHSLGVMHGIMTALHTVCERGEKVIIQPPVYHSFARRLKAARFEILENQLLEKDGKFSQDLDGLEDLMKQGAKAMILCSPHNPVGRIWSKEDLESIVSLCNRYGVYLFSDEIFCDLALFGNSFQSILSVPGVDWDKSAMFTSSSKTFNLAGLHFSVVVCPSAHLRKRYMVSEEAYGYDTAASAFGLVGTEAAFRHGGPWLAEFVSRMEKNVESLEQALIPWVSKIRFQRPEASYLAWLDFRPMGQGGEPLKRLLVEKAGLGLNEGSTFGPGGMGFARMNLACSPEQLEQGVQGLMKILQ